MRTNRTLLLIIFSLSCALFAQTQWAKKDWKKWSEDECKILLEDSPWASTFKESNAQVNNLGNRNNSGTRTDARIETSYTVQLRSALPIRQAVARQILIQNKYDKASDEQKKSLLEKTLPFLDRSYEDVIVVHVVYGSNVAQYENEMMVYWQTHFPIGTVPQDAFLNTPSAKKIAPIRFISPRGAAHEFELIFPRTVNGEPVIEPHDKTISVEFVTPSVGTAATLTHGNVTESSGGSAGRRAYVEFNVDKMKVNGKLAY